MDHKLDKFRSTKALILTEEEKTTIDNLLYSAFTKAFPIQFFKNEVSMGVKVLTDPKLREMLEDQHHVYCKFPEISFRNKYNDLITVGGVNCYVYKDQGTLNDEPYPGYCYSISINIIGSRRQYRKHHLCDLRGRYDYDSNIALLDLSIFDNFWDNLC